MQAIPRIRCTAPLVKLGFVTPSYNSGLLEFSQPWMILREPLLHFRRRDLRILLPTMVQAQQCSWCETRRLGLTVCDAPFRLA